MLDKAQHEPSYSLPSSIRRLLTLMPELIALYEDTAIARTKALAGFNSIQPLDKQYALMSVKDLLFQRLHALDTKIGIDSPPPLETSEPPAV